MIRSPLRRKRLGPPRRGRRVNLPYMAFTRALGCVLSGKHTCSGPTQFHHVRLCGSPKDDERGIGLCPAGHLWDAGEFSIERLGKVGWQEYWGVDLEAEIVRIQRLWEISKGRRL